MTDLEKLTQSNCELNLSGVKWTNKKTNTQYNFFIKNDEDEEQPELWIKYADNKAIFSTYSIEAIDSSCFLMFEDVKYKVILISNKETPKIMELETASGLIEYFEGMS